jgi:(p)ppGpp synthase/HD superfamily hydrolase
MMKVNSLQAKTVAILHDILEDTTVTERNLREIKFDNQTIEAVLLLTRFKDQKYFDYIRKLSHNSLAKEVKIADVQHNLESLKQITKAEERNFLKKRYKKTLSILNK